jgi:hypothetical protein
MSVRGVDAKKIAEDWLKQAEHVGKVYFWRSIDNHKEQMARTDDYPYTGIHAQAYKLMIVHPWGQEYLKIWK